MTTGVYKRWEFIVADKRTVGGHSWLTDTGNKIHHITLDGQEMYVIISGAKLLKSLIEDLCKKYFAWSDREPLGTALYKFKDEINNYSPEFEGMIIFPKTETSPEEAYRLIPINVEEVLDFCSVGSWWYLADGVYLKDPNTLPEDYMPLVSKRDVNTSPTFDLIYLS